MRLLHTSDWHLGRSLHRADLTAAQQSFIDHLVSVVRAEGIDAVLVAGDVYDRAIPPLDAIALFEDALVRLHEAGAAVVVISGNHDSPRRLGVGGRLLDRTGVHLRTRLGGVGEPVLLEGRGERVAVYAVPYLEPDVAGQELGAAVGRSHEAVLGAALARSATDRAARDPRRTVVLAHGWVHGGAVSDSERDIGVGGVSAVPAALFDGFGYAALGHLHRPQLIADRLRYSGSALPYSFSEAGQDKGSWLVDLDADTVEFVATPTYRRLSVLRSDLEDLLSSRAFTEYAGDFLAVTLTDLAQPTGAMERLRARFPHVLTLSWHAPEAVSHESYAARVAGRSDQELMTDFVEYVRSTPATDAERALLADALTGARQDEAMADATGRAA